MNIKTKKKNFDGFVKLETSGEIKEFFISEDFLNPKDAKVSVCFRGKDSSGIINFSVNEIEKMYKEVWPKINEFRNVKVMKFKK